MTSTNHLKAIIYTTLALIAFAGNSVLCRLALADGAIDPASFTNIRLISGIVALLLLSYFSQSKQASTTTNIISQTRQHQTDSVLTRLYKTLTPSLSALYLFIYAIGFSYAYVALDTGTGALILFGAVQLTLITVSLFKTKKLKLNESFGLVLAFSGLVYLVYPSLTTPSLYAFILMSSAGIAWGLYTLSGQKIALKGIAGNQPSPLTLSTHNFVKTTVMIIVLFTISYQQINISTEGITYAIMSGAITSGLGYYLWFIALKYITVIQAGVLQLLVPILASIGGVLFAGEIITIELIIASLLILFGVLIVIAVKK